MVAMCASPLQWTNRVCVDLQARARLASLHRRRVVPMTSVRCCCAAPMSVPGARRCALAPDRALRCRVRRRNAARCRAGRQPRLPGGQVGRRRGARVPRRCVGLRCAASRGRRRVPGGRCWPVRVRCRCARRGAMTGLLRRTRGDSRSDPRSGRCSGRGRRVAARRVVCRSGCVARRRMRVDGAMPGTGFRRCRLPAPHAERPLPGAACCPMTATGATARARRLRPVPAWRATAAAPDRRAADRCRRRGRANAGHRCALPGGRCALGHREPARRCGRETPRPGAVPVRVAAGARHGRVRQWLRRPRVSRSDDRRVACRRARRVRTCGPLRPA